MSDPNLSAPPEGDGVRISRENLDRLEELAKVGRSATDALRENAFLKAKIDLDSPLGRLFYSGYDGELDPQAISQAATLIPGLLAPAEPPAPTGETPPEAPPAAATPTELEAQRQRDLLTGGAVPPGPVTIDRNAALLEEAKGIAKDGTEEDAIVHLINGRANLAAEGDRSVLVQKTRQPVADW